MTENRVHYWRRQINERSGLAATVRHVALALSVDMEADGTNGKPGAEQLAHWCGLTAKTVRSALSALVEAEWLALVEEGGRRGAVKAPNVYAIAFPRSVKVTHHFEGPSEESSSPALKGFGTTDSSLADGTTPAEPVDFDHRALVASARSRPRSEVTSRLKPERGSTRRNTA